MIVALETSSTDLSIAIAEDDGSLIADDGWSAGYRHASELLPRLLAVIEAAGRTLQQTSIVAVGDGPGSFTGLRVGMSVAKAIAVGVSCPVLARPSLSSWLEAEPSTTFAVSRAGAHESYLLQRDAADPTVVAHEGLRDVVRGTAVVAPIDLASVLGLDAALPPFRAAGSLVRAAASALAAGSTHYDLERLEPRYLRAPRGVPTLEASADAAPRGDG